MNEQVSEEQVILVDASDKEVGVLGKTEAHEKGLLHRAFSVFIFNSEGEFLLQRRALGKYHSGGLWTNTCCSHPRPDEHLAVAVKRRLMEEMGMDCDVKEQFVFTYRSELDHGMIEHEVDHVFFGISNDAPDPNPGEVCEWKYVSSSDLAEAIERDPQVFTTWFRICFPRVVKAIKARGYADGSF